MEKKKLKEFKLNRQALKHLAPDDLFKVSGGDRPIIVNGCPSTNPSCVPSSYGSSCCVP